MNYGFMFILYEYQLLVYIADMQIRVEHEKHPLLVAIDVIAEEIGDERGAQAELARRLEVTPQYVNKMVRTLKVPGKRCRQIQAAVKGRVTAEELRPDIFGPPVAAA